jgi:hypothetical protein
MARALGKGEESAMPVAELTISQAKRVRSSDQASHEERNKSHQENARICKR